MIYWYYQTTFNRDDKDGFYLPLLINSLLLYFYLGELLYTLFLRLGTTVLFSVSLTVILVCSSGLSPFYRFEYTSTNYVPIQYKTPDWKGLFDCPYRKYYLFVGTSVSFRLPVSDVSLVNLSFDERPCLSHKSSLYP